GRRGHRDGAAERRPDGRSVPDGPAPPPCRGPRDAPCDRSRPPRARVRTGISLAGTGPVTAGSRRILVLECIQEVSTFNPVPSGVDDFDVRTGEEFFAAHRGNDTEVGGALAAFDAASVTA